MSKPRPKSQGPSPVANGLLVIAAQWRAAADEADAKPEDERSYGDGLRHAADELEQFARN